MSANSLSPFGSVCATCTRRLLQPSRGVLDGAQQQLRHKSKIGKKATTIAVRLRQDLPEYGRKGAVVPMPFGQMRNYYYPQRIADYITIPEKLQMKRDGIVAERDPTFGRAVPEGQQTTRNTTDAASSVPRYDLKTLRPEEAFQLLVSVVPSTLDFYRTPIADTNARQAPGDAHSKSEEAKQVAPPPEMSPRQSPDNIYGSVSTSDINLALKALLQTRGVQGLVVLPDEDIKFVNIAGADVEAARLKKLGEYQYEIRIKGHDEPILRSVRVLADDAASADEQPAKAGESVKFDKSIDAESPAASI